VSMALGAFLAGLVLSDSEYRHELEANIDSFKGLLLGLFFIAVGMSVDFGLMIAKPITVLYWVLTLITGKFLVLWLLGRHLKFSPWVSARFASTLAQGGEFAFVIATIALGFGLITDEMAHLLTLAVAISMGVTPLVLFFMDRMCTKRSNQAPDPKYDIPQEEGEVIIAGFGRVGQIVGRLLRMRDIPFTALEQDYAQVEVVRRFGSKVYYGDASRVDLLEAAKTGHAKYFFLCIDDVDASVRTAEVVLRHFPNIKIVARARNRLHAHRLLDLGVTQIFRETLASSVEMTLSAFKEMGYGSAELKDLETKFREFDEKMLLDQHKVYRDESAVISVSKQAAEQLAQVMQRDQKFAQQVREQSL
jgi:glutathione-regulated potassium-efflux system ancillary protein KefC